MGRRKKLINNTTIPQHQIEAIARCILPDILAFYESEEGQREFADWQVQKKDPREAWEKQHSDLKKAEHHRFGCCSAFLIYIASPIPLFS